MNGRSIRLKKSPFVFLKYVVVVEFIFAFGPIVAAELARLDERYDSTAAAGIVPYPLLITLVVVLLQVLIIGLSFAAWYFATYVVDERTVVYRRGGMFGDKELAKTPTITKIEVSQGPLALRLNYGTLLLTISESNERARIYSVPDPDACADRIRSLIDPVLTTRLAPLNRSALEVIADGENQFVEFKASLIWDYRQMKANKALYEPVMKNLVAFMNSGGGVLVIGVGDNGEILGLEPDYGTMKKPNADGFENVLNMAFNKMIGVEFRRFVEVAFPAIEEKDICVCTVHPSSEPAYLTYRGAEHFYIRTGNTSQALSVSRAARYIHSHFGEAQD